MNVLILGVTGMVGSTVYQMLCQTSHRIFCTLRNKAAADNFPEATVISCDFLNDSSVALWENRLKNIDIIINCVGIFQYNDTAMWMIHYTTPRSIYEAAALCNVKKIIHISALNLEYYKTSYAKSKLAIEEILKKQAIPYVILRPSLIYGSQLRGSMVVFAKLAALPIVPLPEHGQQKFQPIFVNDLAKAIVYFIENDFESATLAAVSSEKISLKQILMCVRRTMKLKPTYFVNIPRFLIKMMSTFGDLISNAMFNIDAMSMLQQGNTTTKHAAHQFESITGIKPINFKKGSTYLNTAALWNEVLFLTRPLFRISLALMWCMSGLTTLFWYPKAHSYQLLSQITTHMEVQNALLYGSSVLNLLLGLGLLLNYKTKISCLIQIFLILIYTLLITIFLPHVWLEPFGPVVKNIPIMIAIVMLYLMSNEE